MDRPSAIAAGASAKAGSGVSGTLASITRADGGTQATYNGAPLYYYAPDTKAGDTIGQGSGGVWFVAKP
jgi:predicted lipoprotein with Yx(FWY)xxD motif